MSSTWRILKASPLVPLFPGPRDHTCQTKGAFGRYDATCRRCRWLQARKRPVTYTYRYDGLPVPSYRQ